MARSKVTRQDAAVALTFAAKTPDEQDRAHVAMRLAFPRLAASYPCDCGACKDARRPR